MKINIFNETNNDISVYIKDIKKLFKKVKDKGIFSIIVVDKEYIHKLNREYRQKDCPTDVISFALNDSLESNYNAQKELGDVFVCYDIMVNQAKEYMHSVKREFCFLCVHGYLHLKGYDHTNEDDRIVMMQKEDEILNKAGIFRNE